MQADGLINKHNRPINTDTTLRTPTPPQVEIYTVPENQESQNNDNSINNSSVSMIHRSIAIPMNRTLPPTRSAGSNITPINTQRLLSVNSPSLNTKLESLESKLCEKIMAMKSMDPYKILGILVATLKQKLQWKIRQNCWKLRINF